MGFLDMIFAVHAGIKSASKNSSPADWRYKDLESTPYLYGSDYLSELQNGAKEEWQQDAVFEHMVRYGVDDMGYEGYDRVKSTYKRQVNKR